MSFISEELFSTFARSYDPPSWIIKGLQQSGEPGVKDSLNAALEAIPAAAIGEVDEKTHVMLDLKFSNIDRDERARLHIVSCMIERELYQRRASEIRRINGRPRPFDHPALQDVAVDSDGLVPLSEFRINGDALCRNGHAFFVLPAVPSFNANYWLLQNIQRQGVVDAVSVRLDPFVNGPEAELAGRFYRMDVYGRALNWDRIRALRVPEHGQWFPDNLSSDSSFTDYVWSPDISEVEFLCEELPSPSAVEVRGSRYLHAIFDKQSNCFTHLDGAVRVYTTPELEHRSTLHVRNAGKMGQRIKVFRTDHHISPAAMGDMASAFFVWNYDVARYFSSSTP